MAVDVYGAVQQFNAGIVAGVSNANVNDTTPTQAEIQSAMAGVAGMAFADIPNGFQCFIHDNAGNTNLYHVVKLGTKVAWTKMTVAL